LLVVVAQEPEQAALRYERDVAAQDQEVAGKIPKDISGTAYRMTRAELALLENPIDSVIGAASLYLLRTVSHNDRNPLGI
jgi:hypothetical protein